MNEEELFEAYIAGFLRSGEGFNGEYPISDKEWSIERVKEALRDGFNQWLETERGEPNAQ